VAAEWELPFVLIFHDFDCFDRSKRGFIQIVPDSSLIYLNGLKQRTNGKNTNCAWTMLQWIRMFVLCALFLEALDQDNSLLNPFIPDPFRKDVKWYSLFGQFDNKL